MGNWSRLVKSRIKRGIISPSIVIGIDKIESWEMMGMKMEDYLFLMEIVVSLHLVYKVKYA